MRRRNIKVRRHQRNTPSGAIVSVKKHKRNIQDKRKSKKPRPKQPAPLKLHEFNKHPTIIILRHRFKHC